MRKFVSDRAVRLVVRCLANRYGVDVSKYKEDFLRRRIYARMVALRVRNTWEYLRVLETRPEEMERLLDSMSINVSRFFRDPAIWDKVKEIVLLPMIKEKLKFHGMLRIWSAGCSCGEEPYTIAILVKEILDALKARLLVRIYATDVDVDALRRAELGIYPAYELVNVRKDLLLRYFYTTTSREYAIRNEIKRMVIFKVHDLLKEPPLDNMDVVFCRNVLIYFNKLAQAMVIRKFMRALRRGGYLVLGATESLSSEFLDYFEVVDLRGRIYRLRGLPDHCSLLLSTLASLSSRSEGEPRSRLHH